MAAHELFPPQAVWIGSAHPFDLHEVYLDFRSPAAWTLPRLPAHAELRITADSRYRLWLNGEFVGRGPGRGYPWRQSRGLHRRDGLSARAAPTRSPCRSTSRAIPISPMSTGARPVCSPTLVGDGEPLLHTGVDWRVRRNPSFAELVPRVSIYGSGVELRDLTLDDDWTAPAYDAAQWATPRVVAPLGGAPWVGIAGARAAAVGGTRTAAHAAGDALRTLGARASRPPTPMPLCAACGRPLLKLRSNRTNRKVRLQRTFPDSRRIRECCTGIFTLRWI